MTTARILLTAEAILNTDSRFPEVSDERQLAEWIAAANEEPELAIKALDWSKIIITGKIE